MNRNRYVEDQNTAELLRLIFCGVPEFITVIILCALGSIYGIVQLCAATYPGMLLTFACGSTPQYPAKNDDGQNEGSQTCKHLFHFFTLGCYVDPYNDPYLMPVAIWRKINILQKLKYHPEEGSLVA